MRVVSIYEGRLTQGEKSVGEGEEDEGIVEKSQTHRSQLQELRFGLAFTSGLKEMPSTKVTQERQSRSKTHGPVMLRGLLR